MKRSMLIAGFVVLAAGPARAGLVGSLDPVTTATNLTLSPGGHGTMGILNAAGNIITSNVMLYPNASDLITVTFGIHWPYNTPVLVERNRNGLVWDTTEVVLLGAGPAGPFVTNNISTTPAAGANRLNSLAAPLSGTEDIRGIEQFPASPFIFAPSSTIPFFRVTFRAQSPFSNDGLLDLLAPERNPIPPNMTFNTTFEIGLIFRFFSTTMTTGPSGTANTNINPSATLLISAGPVTRPSFGLDLVPEPASASLLALGMLAIVGGAWQRRQRARDQSSHLYSYRNQALPGSSP